MMDEKRMKKVNLIGKTFGRLIVVEDSGKRDKYKCIKWKCKCTCENMVEISSRNLRSGHTRSCGCLAKERAKKDLIGQRFGRLIVLKDTGKRNWRSVIWRCKCDCGNIVDACARDLIAKATRSCGCLKRDNRRILAQKIIHGDARHGKITRLYNIWAGMKRRVMGTYAINYKYYGGKGIQICSEWLGSYQNFKNWALANGYADNLTIDRIDSNGNYEPFNCQWLTKSENSRKQFR